MTIKLNKHKIDFRYILFSIFAIALIGTLSVMMFNNMKETDAADMSGFRAGNIMSDEVMSNANSMSEGEIQNWLSSMNPCDNYDYGYYLQLKAAHPNRNWHFTDHFVCISQERFGDGMTIGSGDSAAHIIWQAAQDYQINPQVLIVLLQKESGIITDRIPNDFDYRTAAGYGCPDGAPCEASYFGLKNQVRLAAKLFRDVLNGGWSTYPAYRDNYVQYNPNKGCGGTSVYIENRATSALYRYTPYQPNGAALASDYGVGDACSAYGNRNFYAYFTDWFGDTRSVGSAGEATSLSEGVYSFSSKLNFYQKMDIADGSVQSGARVQMYNSNGSNAQNMEVTNAGDGYVYIKNIQSGKMIDLQYQNTADGGKIWQYDWNGGCAQKWRPIQTPDGYITFESACAKGKVMDVTNGNPGNRNNVQLWSANNSDAQKWQLVPVSYLENGTYEIKTSLNTNMGVDILNGSTEDGAKVQLYSLNGSAAQEWTFIRDGSGYYKIMNPHSGKYIDLRDAKIANETTIWQYTGNDSCAQKWGVLSKNDGSHTLVSACASNKVIDLKNAAAINYQNIQLYTANNTNAQNWFITPKQVLNNGQYAILSGLSTAKSFDVMDGSVENGANIQLYDNNGTGAQRWTLSHQDNGFYTIQNTQSNKNVDLAGARTNNEANIWQYQSNGTCAQRWKLIKVGDERYAMISACNQSKAIDLKWGLLNNGNKIQLYDLNFSGAQTWVIRQI